MTGIYDPPEFSIRHAGFAFKVFRSWQEFFSGSVLVEHRKKFGRGEDRHLADASQGEKIVVAADKPGALPGLRATDELVVLRVPTPMPLAFRCGDFDDLRKREQFGFEQGRDLCARQPELRVCHDMEQFVRRLARQDEAKAPCAPGAVQPFKAPAEQKRRQDAMGPDRKLPRIRSC